MAGRALRMGVALGARHVVSVMSAAGGTPRATHHALEPIGEDGRWPALAEVLAALRSAAGGGGRRVEFDVALLPPDVQVRPLEVPPLDAPELEHVIARNPSRYFLGAREPQVIGVASAVPRKGEQHSVMAGAAPVRLVNAIEEAAAQAGCTVRGIVPAEAAWIAAARAFWPDVARGAHAVLVRQQERIVLLRVQDGALAGVRRFRDLDLDADRLGEALHEENGTETICMLGAGSDAGRIQRLSGVPVREAPAGRSSLAGDPDDVAAAFAAGGRSLEFVSARRHVARQARARRLVGAVFGAAAALLVVAAAFQRLAIARDLQRVQAERAALRGQVSEFVATQDFVSAVGRQLGELNDAVTGTPRWSRVLVSLSRTLPPSAYLTTLQGQADSLVVEGFATSATGVFRALSGDSTIVDVHSAAPVRSSFLESGEPRDHFTIAGHVRGAHPTPLAAPPRKAP